jgi:lipopolysaccharide transport system ATP-binding protein
MSSLAINVNNISKRYRIGAAEHVGKTFREAIIDGISTPVRNLSRLRNLTRFKDEDEPDVIWALKDVSFKVEEGEVLGIIGRNGAGKTTLLKILSRITEPTSGYAEIRGRVSSLLEVGTGFHPELTGRENIFLNGAILGMRKQEIERKFDQILSFAEVEKFVDTPVKRYSRGMQVRLAFAVAAHLEPEILLIDEVLAVGDAAFQKKCLGTMEAAAKGGRTIFFVSHNMGMINTLCDRCILLDGGRVIQDGDTSSVVSKYLSDISPATGSECSFPPDQSKKAQIRRVTIMDQNLNQKTQFDVFEQVVIEIEYEVREELFGSMVALILSRQGIELFRSFDTDTNRKIFDKRLPGHYRTRVNLPCPLKAGAYVLGVHTGIASRQGIDLRDNIVSFDVKELSFNPGSYGYASHRAGIIATLLTWETNRVE